MVSNIIVRRKTNPQFCSRYGLYFILFSMGRLTLQQRYVSLNLSMSAGTYIITGLFHIKIDTYSDLDTWPLVFFLSLFGLEYVCRYVHNYRIVSHKKLAMMPSKTWKKITQSIFKFSVVHDICLSKLRYFYIKHVSCTSFHDGNFGIPMI